MIKQVSAEFSRFIIVGLISTALSYGVFFVCYSWLNVHYVASSGIGYMSGLFLGYVINRNWTFGEHKSDTRTKEFSLYISVYLISLLLNLGTIALAVDSMHIHPLFANIIAIGVSTMTNFIGLKLVVFRHTHTT